MYEYNLSSWDRDKRWAPPSYFLTSSSDPSSLINYSLSKTLTLSSELSRIIMKGGKNKARDWDIAIKMWFQVIGWPVRLPSLPWSGGNSQNMSHSYCQSVIKQLAFSSTCHDVTESDARYSHRMSQIYHMTPVCFYRTY